MTRASIFRGFQIGKHLTRSIQWKIYVCLIYSTTNTWRHSRASPLGTASSLYLTIGDLRCAHWELLPHFARKIIHNYNNFRNCMIMNAVRFFVFWFIFQMCSHWELLIESFSTNCDVMSSEMGVPGRYIRWTLSDQPNFSRCLGSPASRSEKKWRGEERIGLIEIQLWEGA